MSIAGVPIEIDLYEEVVKNLPKLQELRLSWNFETKDITAFIKKMNTIKPLLTIDYYAITKEVNLNFCQNYR